MNLKITIKIILLIVLACNLRLAFSLNDTSEQELQNNIDPKKLTAAIAVPACVYVGGISYLSFIWYKDHQRVPLHFYNDNAGYLQMDKMGHAFGAYLESYACYSWLRKAGVNKNKALIFGGSAGFLMQLPIEIFDGLYQGWGFSWGDVIANTAGSALMVGQEVLFDQQIIRHKMSFSKSEYFDQSNGYLGGNVFESFFYDYNSHTHWFSSNVSNFLMHETLPPWLNIAVGYSANGMFGEFKNLTYYNGVRLPEIQRTRQFLLSLDIDWEKIHTNSPLLKALFKGLNFVKVPFPALEINSQGKLKGYWLYF